MIPASVYPAPGDHELLVRLTRLIESFRRPRIAVVGDLIADEFICGGIDRVSREAPVLILKYDSTEVTPGGAGNIRYITTPNFHSRSFPSSTTTTSRRSFAMTPPFPTNLMTPSREPRSTRPSKTASTR